MKNEMQRSQNGLKQIVDTEEAEKKYREKLAALAVYKNNSETCSACGHSGVITAMSNEYLNAEYSFCCPFCSTAEILELSYPVWRGDLKGEYTMIEWSNFFVGLKDYRDGFKQ